MCLLKMVNCHCFHCFQNLGLESSLTEQLFSQRLIIYATMPMEGNLKKGTKQRLSLRSRLHEGDMRTPRMAEEESILPPEMRSKIWKLFRQIERELEGMYEENIGCKLPPSSLRFSKGQSTFFTFYVLVSVTAKM